MCSSKRSKINVCPGLGRCCPPCMLMHGSEIKLFVDDCICYREIKDTEDSETSEGHRSSRMLGKEIGYEIPTSQMQYNADF